MFGFSADSVEKNALPKVLAVLKELFPNELKEKLKLSDKTSPGADKPTQNPPKKPTGDELSEAEKEANQVISQARIYVEHPIRRGKGYQVVSDKSILAQGIF